MHRLTARVLLVLLLAGTFVPAALAFTPTPPHACCMRKMHQDSDQAQLTAVHYDHRCCGPWTISRWAQPRPVLTEVGIRQSAPLGVPAQTVHRDFEVLHGRSGRSPPLFSIA
jgi:hypothetical protein